MRHGHKPPRGAVVHRGAKGGIWYESSRGHQPDMDDDYKSRTSGRTNKSQLRFDSYKHEEDAEMAYYHVKSNYPED